MGWAKRRYPIDMTIDEVEAMWVRQASWGRARRWLWAKTWRVWH